jgi:hypothetical protein
MFQTETPVSKSITALGIYILISMLFVFGALMEYATMLYSL